MKKPASRLSSVRLQEDKVTVQGESTSMNNPQSSDAPAGRSDAGSPESGVSPGSPLRQAVFRAVWIASITSNIGTWMQSVGAAWLMTSLTPSPLLVALMQTAASLPIFLLGLPAGALADVVDRRKLLLVTESWMLLVALALGVLTLAGLMSAWTLLALTFLLGLGAALDAPAWQAIIPELVERQELPSALALNATGFNLARALGPALSGLVVAAAAPAAVFLLNAASFLAVLVVIYHWQLARIPSDAPPEAMLDAIADAMRYLRHAPALQPSSCASASSFSAPAPCGPCCRSWPGTSWVLRRPAMGSSWAALVLARWVVRCSCHV